MIPKTPYNLIFPEGIGWKLISPVSLEKVNQFSASMYSFLPVPILFSILDLHEDEDFQQNAQVINKTKAKVLSQGMYYYLLTQDAQFLAILTRSIRLAG